MIIYYDSHSLHFMVWAIFPLPHPSSTLLPGWSSSHLLNPLNPCSKTYMLLIATKASFLGTPKSHLCPLPCLAGALPAACTLQALLPYCSGFWCLRCPAQTQRCSHLLQRIFSWWSTDAPLATPHSALLFNSCCQVFTHSLFISCWIICSPYRFRWLKKIKTKTTREILLRGIHLGEDPLLDVASKTVPDLNMRATYARGTLYLGFMSHTLLFSRYFTFLPFIS